MNTFFFGKGGGVGWLVKKKKEEVESEKIILYSHRITYSHRLNNNIQK